MAAQLERIRAYCLANGLELVAIHEDAGLSGKRADNRPGLQAALADVCNRGGVLVVYSLSRLARSVSDSIRWPAWRPGYGRRVGCRWLPVSVSV